MNNQSWNHKATHAFKNLKCKFGLVVPSAAVCTDVRACTSAHLRVTSCLPGSPKVPSLTPWRGAMFATRAKEPRFTMLIEPRTHSHSHANLSASISLRTHCKELKLQLNYCLRGMNRWRWWPDGQMDWREQCVWGWGWGWGPPQEGLQRKLGFSVWVVFGFSHVFIL